jgi:hypothetical protein
MYRKNANLAVTILIGLNLMAMTEGLKAASNKSNKQTSSIRGEICSTMSQLLPVSLNSQLFYDEKNQKKIEAMLRVYLHPLVS